MEQDLKLRQISDRLNSGDVDYKDIVTVFLALQKQNFVLANSMINLVNKWPTLHEDIIFIGPSERIQKEIQTEELS